MMRGRTRENQGDINNLLGMDKLDFELESSWTFTAFYGNLE